MSTTTAPQSPLTQFQSVQAEGSPRYLNALVYGTSGQGKTLLGATGPSPIIFIDMDDGLQSVRSVRPELVTELGIDTKQIYTERVRNYAELKKTITKIGALRNHPAFPKTIVIDNLTVAQSICMQERISGDESVSIDRLPERQDWGVLLQRMRAIVRYLRDLPCNSYFVAMEQEKEGAIGPALQGAIFREIPAMCDLVARYSILSREVDDGAGGKTIEERRFLQCQPSAAIPGRSLAVIAKDRSGRLSRFEKPNLKGLLDKIYGPVDTVSITAPDTAK